MSENAISVLWNPDDPTVLAAYGLLMLAWSKPWLDRFAYGPFEWLWRSLARWQIQPMRKRIPARNLAAEA